MTKVKTVTVKIPKKFSFDGWTVGDETFDVVDKVVRKAIIDSCLDLLNIALTSYTEANFCFIIDDHDTPPTPSCVAVSLLNDDYPRPQFLINLHPMIDEMCDHIKSLDDGDDSHVGTVEAIASDLRSLVEKLERSCVAKRHRDGKAATK